MKVPANDELWVLIPGYDEYLASNYGRVKRRFVTARSAVNCKDKSGVLSPCFNTNGYPRVCLRVGGKSRAVEVHKLISLAFIGPRPRGLCVNHKDGCKWNNCPDNLEYVTQSENQKHACDLGLCRDTRQRALDRAVKLTESDITAILYLETRLTQREIARRFGVCCSTVNHIFKGRLWGHITGRKVVL